MFRPMRRFRQQLEREECLQLLRSCPRGVLACLGDEDYPYTVPLDFWYDEENGVLCFHGAKEGHKLDALLRHDKVSFCIMDEGERVSGDWTLTCRSVVVFGRARVIRDRERTLEAARRLGLKYYPDAESVEEEMRKAADRVLCWELVPEHITGKRVHES